jgi:hypothetical protein
MNSTKISLLYVACALTAQAQLSVTVLPVKMTGQKAVVLLAITNGLAESVESARAACFLIDEQGKMVGQSTKWVIGGMKDRPALQPKSDTTFNFVITSSRPFVTTNLTAQISFSRLVLEGQKLGNLKTDVQIQNGK